MVVTIAWNIIARRRQTALAATRPAIDEVEFTKRLVEAGVTEAIAKFVWNEFQPYYFAPLTPYPEDRPVGEMRIDADDLSDIVTRFEKQFGRKWIGKWVGPDDPTLIQFAVGLSASTSEE